MANDIIDIDVFQTVENVEITVEPNLTTVNITDSVAVTDVTKLAILNNLSDLNNVSTARTNLGLGTLATQNGTFTDKANLASPIFTGVPLAPTAAANTNTTQIATTAFATGAVSGKMNTPSLTVNTIPKALTASTIGNSRIVDTGTFIGIGTVNTPTKHITLGNGASKEIGVEDSNNVTDGFGLTISTGRAVSASSANFNSLSQTSRDWRGMTTTSSGDVYACVFGGDIYMQTAGTGAFVALGQTSRNWLGMTTTPSGNVYACVFGGDIYMQTAGTGAFVSLGQTSRDWRGMTTTPSGNVYACVFGGDIYMQTAGTGNFVALSQTSRDWHGMTTTPSGNVYACLFGGDIYMQTAGTGAFVALGQTSRDWRSITTTSSGNVYASVWGGDIYMQTAGTGAFVALSQTSRNWWGMTTTTSGNVFACVSIGDIYMQTSTLGTPDLSGGTLRLLAGTAKGTGSSDIEFYTGQKTVSGVDSQVSTLRAKINNEGLMTLPSVTNALISAGGAKAIITKEYADATYSGGGGSTNLSTTYAPTTVTVVSDTGTDATIKAVDGTDAGIVTVAQKTTWDGKQDALGFTPYNATNPSGYQTASQVQTIADAKVTNKMEIGSLTSSPSEDFLYNVFEFYSNDISNKQPLSAVLTATTASFTTADETKLDGIATGATANSSDATLLARANHTGTQLSSTISDFNSATRAQVEAELVAGSGVTITPSGTGATRQLTITSTGGSSTQSAYTILANNTASTAIPTEQPFESIAEQVYSGAIVQAATTAATGATAHNYQWTQIGKLVTLQLNIDFATGGISVTAMNCELPNDLPSPAIPSSVTLVNQAIAYGSGSLSLANGLGTSPATVILRTKSLSPNVFEISINRSSGNYANAYATISYFTP